MSTASRNSTPKPARCVSYQRAASAISASASGSISGGPVAFIGVDGGVITASIALRAPAAVQLTADADGPYTIGFGQSLNLDGSDTTYSGSGTLSYSWDIMGVGGAVDATGAKPSLSWVDLQALGVAPGAEYTVSLSVTDGQGASDTKLQTVYKLDPISGGAGMRVNFVRITKEA